MTKTVCRKRPFDDDPAEGVRPRRQAFGYDVEYSIDSMPFLKDMIDILEDIGWNLHDVVAEGAYSQFELDFHYTDLLEMADRFVFLRILLKEIAKQHGMFITFMPKPTLGDWRSGAHINFSMQRTDKSGENIFKEGDGWSAKSRHAVGGLMTHAEGNHRHHLSNREFVQWPGTARRRLRGRHGNLGANQHYLRVQQPLGTVSAPAKSILY